MLLRWQFIVLTVLGAVALALVLVNAGLFTLNREAHTALGQRQQYVQQTVALEALYRDIVKALAELAVKGNDPQLLAVLGAQGLSVTVDARRRVGSRCQPGPGAQAGESQVIRRPVAAAVEAV